MRPRTRFVAWACSSTSAWSASRRSSEIVKDEQEDRKRYFRKQKALIDSGYLKETGMPTGEGE